MKKLLGWIVLILLHCTSLYFLIITIYTYNYGNRVGRLIKLLHKGYIFKTDEGELNLGGISTTNGGVPINNMWEFSVEGKSVADSLSKLEGRDVTLHYKEKMSVLPWLGESKYIVDKIIQVR